MAEAAGATPRPALELSASPQFAAWLAGRRASLAFTTYRAGKLVLIGLTPDGRLSVFERSFSRSMGLAVAEGAQTLWLATLHQLWRFENALPAGRRHDDYDRLYVPQAGYTTGALDVHDVAIDADGRPVFVNTLFSCLATTSETHSFRPIWRPPFVSALAAEDRCHLNGLAMERGRPRFATAVSRSDAAQGWREDRVGGGVVLEVATGEVAASGLSMPHSPRLHRGRLWLLNSGTGEFGACDLATGRFEPATFCEGYLRGLAFSDDFAVVGTSKHRDDRAFTGLPLDDALAARRAEPRCAVLVIDLRTGEIAHWLRIEGVIAELYDVALLNGVARAMVLGFKTDEIERVLTIEDGAET